MNFIQFFHETDIGTSVIDYIVLRMKSNFTFVNLVSLNSEINLKSDNGPDRFINRSNLHPHRGMGTFDVRELAARIIKSGINVEQPSGIVI